MEAVESFKGQKKKKKKRTFSWEREVQPSEMEKILLCCIKKVSSILNVKDFFDQAYLPTKKVGNKKVLKECEKLEKLQQKKNDILS
jgi:hypothetical protein